MSFNQRTYGVRLHLDGAKAFQAEMRASGAGGERAMRRIGSSSVVATRGLRGVSAASLTAQHNLTGFSRNLPAIGRMAALLGGTAIATGIAGIGSNALGAAKQFEASMKRVQAALRLTGAEMDPLEAKARQLGETTAFTASEAADAMEVLAKNGLNATQILGGAIDASLSLSGALGGELDKSADLITDLMLQFGLAEEDLAQIVDLTTGAALKSKLGFDDLRLAIGSAGGVAGGFGVDIRDFLAALSATAPAFSSGRDAGTSFKTFLQRLTPESKQARAAMEELGLEFFDAEGGMKSLADIAEELRIGLDGLSDQDRNASLKTIFGTDAIRTAILLAKQGKDGFTSLYDAIGDVSAAEQAQVRLEGLDGALRVLASSWEALQLRWAADGNLDGATHLVEKLTDAIRYLNDNFAEVSEQAERVGHALAVFLVGKGINLAVAKAISMRAAYIALAQSVTSVGVASARSAGLLAKLAVNGRVLTAFLGGPAGLALTAATLLTLAVNTDSTKDAIDRAKRASEQGETALDKYTDAVKRAADEQERLGGKVSRTTRNLLTQSRLELQKALTEVQESGKGLRDDLFGKGLFDLSDIDILIDKISNRLGRTNSKNPFLQGVNDGLKSYRDDGGDLSGVVAGMKELMGVQKLTKESIDEFQKAAVSGVAEDIENTSDDLMQMAETLGLFGDEIQAVKDAQGGDELVAAWDALAESMREAVDASAFLHTNDGKEFVDLASGLVDAEQETDKLKNALTLTKEEILAISKEQNPLNPVEEGAKDALKPVKELGDELKGISDLISGLPKDLGVAIQSLSNSTDSVGGSAQLIRKFEGFRSKPYWDVDAYRAGYGSDTVTLADGTIQKITSGMRVSVADAQRDLTRRIGEFQNGIRGQIGSDRFDAFNPAQQAVLTSLAYNYGELPDRIVEAIQNGTTREIGEAIGGLRGDNGGVNNDRRLAEASVFVNGIGTEEAAVRQYTESQKAVEAATRAAAKVIEEQRMAMERNKQARTALVDAADQEVSRLEFEQSLIGKSVGEVARLRFMYEQLASAKQQGVNVDLKMSGSSETLRQYLLRQAQAVGELAQAEADRAARQGDAASMNETISGSLKGMLDEPINDWGDLASAAGNALNQIKSKLLHMAFDPVFDAIAEKFSGMFSGGGSGGSGGIVGFFTKILGFADGGSLASAPGMQMGGRAQGFLSGVGGPRDDNILFLGSRGEFMQPAATVDYYGVEFMEALRNRSVPKFATGGLLGGSSAPSLGRATPGATGGPLIGSLNVEVHTDGTSDDAQLTGEEIAKELVAKLPDAINAQLLEQSRSGGIMDALYERKRGY